jgi:hypothetical protein
MSKNTTVPSYLVLVSQLLDTCDRLGLTPQRADITATRFSSLPENEGWCFLRFGTDENAPAILIGKNKGVLRVHSHVDFSDLPGWIELTKYNGRVIGHIDASLADWDKIVARLPEASKRPIKRASKATVEAPDMSAFLATLAAKGTGKAPASPTTPEAPAVEEMEQVEEDFSEAV